MAIKLQENQDGKFVEVQINGKLKKEDYDHFVPQMDRLFQQHGKLRLLVDMADFHGFEMGALWADIKFDFKHFKDFERISMVGDKKWHKGMAQFCKPFTTAQIRYFDQSSIQDARQWAAA